MIRVVSSDEKSELVNNWKEFIATLISAISEISPLYSNLLHILSRCSVMSLSFYF